MAELERRIEYAVAVARASEEAALEIGAAAIDAAEQARRAAELAERASERAAWRAAPAPTVAGDGAATTPSGEQWGGGEEILRQFTERADRVAARFARLEQSASIS